jgi:hypothetical protein
MSNAVPLTLGSDLTFTGVWLDESGEVMPLTGYAIELFDAHPLLAAATIEWTDAAVGAFSLLCQYRPEWSVGRLMSFRIRVRLEGYDRASPMIWVNIE